MRKSKIILSIILITICSCDPTNYHDFYIKNSCKDDIEVNIYYREGRANPASGKPLITNFVIEPNNNKLVGNESTISSFDYINYYFDSIIIKKCDVISNIDYLDYSRWDSKKKSKRHTESYLTVYPEDFEDE